MSRTSLSLGKIPSTRSVYVVPCTRTQEMRITENISDGKRCHDQKAPEDQGLLRDQGRQDQGGRTQVSGVLIDLFSALSQSARLTCSSQRAVGSRLAPSSFRSASIASVSQQAVSNGTLCSPVASSRKASTKSTESIDAGRRSWRILSASWLSSRETKAVLRAVSPTLVRSPRGVIS